MPSNLQINDILLAKAQQIGGFRTKKDTVNGALAEFVRRHEQLRIVELFGTIDYDPAYDYKKERSKR